MDLWTEFEGVTIDSSFALNKLLQSEGRSAFFSTVNAKGESVLIRIVECHFDEDEILARWRGVQTLGHPNFLRIDRFGQFLIEEDGITAVYALFERVDANLAQVLEQGCLSPADAAQIGLSIASALETLHTHGFVHQHIEPRKVFSVADTVKLRSDCIRETPEGEAGNEARRRDVHDLALLLMQVLLGTTRFSGASPQFLVPTPFEDIVRNGISGAWGLAEINAALTPLASSKAKAAPAGRQAVSATTAKLRDLVSRPSPSGETAPPQPRSELRGAATSESAGRASIPRHRPAHFEPRLGILSPDHPFRRWIAPGAMLVLVLLLGWIFMHLLSGHRTGTATQALQTAPTSASTSRVPAARSIPQRTRSNQPAPAPGAGPRARTDWRVVAFTYNRQDQAQKKASSLAEKHPDLHPQVFSPTGKAPWLVTIGGGLPRDAAFALAHKARSAGLPRDTYAQNYTVR
jgi:hypothetical protein